MPVTIEQSASWPGVAAVESCSGTVSHGITPGVFVMATYPQTALPSALGDLVLSDGLRSVRFRGCKLDAISGRAGSDGQTYTLTILDRRWKWRYGAISGRYNQVERRSGKLVPWTIRSPKELAELCLEEMGEKNSIVRLPDRLSQADGADFGNFLKLGEKFPQSFTNPPTVWDMTNPAEALARLAELYGCRVVYQPLLDRVLVVPLGAGKALPEGACESIAPNLDGPETPSAVGIAGAPVRIQMRLLLEAVGREWDQSFRPVNELSYAPQKGGKVQIATAAFVGPAASPSIKLRLTFNTGGELPTAPPNQNVDIQFGSSATGSAGDKMAAAAEFLNAHPVASQFVTATGAATLSDEGSGGELTVTGKRDGFAFSLTSETSSPAPNRTFGGVTQAPERAGGNWESCPPPNFPDVRPTDRLSYDQAIQLAQASVFRCYRVLNADAGTGTAPIQVPWVGTIAGRHRLVLQPTKVDQVEPEPREKGVARPVPQIADKIRRDLGGLPEFYNGTSRDQKADVYGSVARRIGGVVWDNQSPNTGPEDKVYADFELDPEEQVVTFSEYVFVDSRLAGSDFRQGFPALTLETAVLVSKDTTGEILRYKSRRAIGGVAPVEWQVREDVQMSVKGKYGEKNKLTGFDFVGQDDADARATYYLTGMANRHELSGGETRQYIGIIPIDLDGFVQQVSFSIGGGGATTVASTNSEHSPNVPPYPARRRAENLPPDKSAALANLAERAGRGGPNPVTDMAGK